MTRLIGAAGGTRFFEEDPVMRPFAWLFEYGHTSVPADLVATVTVWALLVPQALAYSQLAGLPAVNGMYAALGAVALYGVYGTSRHLDVGPEATVATLVASTISDTPVTGRLLSAVAITDIDVTALQVMHDHLDVLHERGIKVAIARVGPGFYEQVDRVDSMLDICDAVYYEIDDGVEAFRQGRFAADQGVLDSEGALRAGVTIDRSEVRFDEAHPDQDLRATQEQQAERSELADDAGADEADATGPSGGGDGR